MAIWQWGQAQWGSGLWSSVPSRMADPIEEDVPRAKNYKTVLAATTLPVKVAGLPPSAPTPAPWSDWTIQDDRPIAPEFRRALLYPAIFAPIFIPPPFLSCDLSSQDDRPIARDYRVALASTTMPVMPIFVPVIPNPGSAVARRIRGYWPALQASTRPIWTPFLPPAPVATPVACSNLSRQDDRPIARDYRTALGATSSPRQVLFPPPPPAPPAIASVVTPDPIRPNYAVALGSTTRPVGQLIGAVPVGTTPSNWWWPPDQPTPRGGNYKPALDASSRPVLVTSFRTAVTPTRWCAMPLEPLPRRKDYLPALWATSGIKNVSEPPPPPPPPPVSCVVQEVPGVDQGHVTLVAGTATITTLASQPVPGVVSLTGSTTTTQPLSPAADNGSVPFVPNPHCP